MFLFKKSKIFVDAFTTNAGIYEHSRPSEAVEFLPQWWKDLPKRIDVQQYGIDVPLATMKMCEGFIDQYKHSFIVPLWSDLIIKTFETGQWTHVFSTPDTPSIEEHIAFMTRDVSAFNKLIQLKLMTPWLLVEKEGINFQLTDPVWNRLTMPTIHTAPGILNFKYQNALVNVFLAEKRDATMTFHEGDPLLSLTPMTEKEVVFNYHLVSAEEYKRISDRTMYRSSFSGFHRKNKRRCPFSGRSI